MPTLYFAACALAIFSYWMSDDQPFGRTIASIVFSMAVVSACGGEEGASRLAPFYLIAPIGLMAIGACFDCEGMRRTFVLIFLFSIVCIALSSHAPHMLGILLFIYWAWVVASAWTMFAKNAGCRVNGLRFATATLIAASFIADLVCIGWWMRTGSYVEEQIVSTFFLSVLATLPILWTARTRIA